MVRKIPPAVWLVLPLAFLLYFYHLTAVGLIGPDEPRYAAISRTMASSGDWVTPRLLGKPWFEKPALLYWMEAIFFRAGFGPELAPRLPVALFAIAFLGFFWWILRREFGGLPAAFSTAILGSCAAWVVASQTGTTDLPLAATYSAAMLLALPWVRRRDPAWLPWVAALLALGVLSKGPVALALAWPIAVPWKSPFRQGLGANIRTLLRPWVVLPFLLIALPWYALCTLANGRAFLADFFWKHNVERMLSSTAVGNHGQPIWYFGPVLLALLLPWTPLLPLVLRRSLYADPGRLFLLVWAALWLVFFSISANKLPSYILPMIPAAAVLLGIALAEVSNPAPWLAVCALLLIAYPVAAPIVPVAVATGLTHAPRPHFQWTWLAPLAVAVLVGAMAVRGKRLAAVLTIVAGSAAGTVAVKSIAAHDLDRIASARAVWRQLSARQDSVCIDWVPRGMEYSLDYYFVPPLPRCDAKSPRPVWLHQLAGQTPATGPPKPKP
ncbi:MAG TPA: glycosyltransferase family 39 protein [Bryobacteraceae bacterium]|nr:glycosyltransferase family 39 protein [Bryobacteraceae bacterium]